MSSRTCFSETVSHNITHYTLLSRDHSTVFNQSARIRLQKHTSTFPFAHVNLRLEDVRAGYFYLSIICFRSDEKSFLVGHSIVGD